MGLDMYLYKDYYIGGNFEHRNVTGTVQFDLNGTALAIPTKEISEVRTLVGYWRKANAIHKFFVDNVMGGKDECYPHQFEPDVLEKLLDLCKQVKKNHKLAPSLLPTQSGFFFGSYEYDQWYFEDIDYTIKILTEVLSKYEQEKNKKIYCDFYYYPSW